MPSSYSPPDVIVQQVRRTNLGTLRPPQLPVVVVGLARQIQTRVWAGTYDATVESNVALPGLAPGAITDPNSVQIVLDARSDSGKPLGLFQLNPTEFTIVNDAANLPSRLLISKDITIEMSVLSARNNQGADAAANDYGSGTPEGIVFTDSAVDFLAKGSSPDGDTFIVISSPASMAGVYQVIELIANGNVVRSVIVEKVLSDDYGQPELVKSVAINGATTPSGSTIRGFDAATHEAALLNGQNSNLTAATVGAGIGVTGLVDLDGGGTTEFNTAAITALLTSGVGSPRLSLPGVGSNESVIFAPVDVAGDPINRTNALWTSMIAAVNAGDWLRARYAALGASAVDAAAAITYTGASVGTIAFTTAAFVQAGWVGRTLRLTGNGNAANNRDYEVLSANAATNTVVVDLTPFGGVFPGGASATQGSGQVLAQVAMDRDFKVLAVDRTAKTVTISALGDQIVADDVISLPVLGLTSFGFLKVIRGRTDAVNGAGDFVTFSVDGAPYRFEADFVTPSAVRVVGTLPSFAATAHVNATSALDDAGTLINFGTGVLEFATPNFVQSTWVGKTARLSHNSGAGNDGDYVISAVSVPNNTVTVIGSFPTPAVQDGDVDIIDFVDVPVIYRRGVPYRNSAASYDLTKRMSDAWTADIEVSYIATRQDLALNGLMELSSRKDIETIVGPIHPDNPLAFGCDMIVRSGLADGVRTFYALATNGESVGDHVDAMETLETSDVYFIVPMTQDTDVIAAYKSHVDTQSLPANKHERVVLVNTPLITVEDLIPVAGSPAPTGVIDTAMTLTASTDWGLVNPGDVVNILTNPGTATEAVEASNRVVSVDLANNKVTFLAPWAAALVGTTRSFSVTTYPLTKLEQAENWRDYSKSIGDSRVMVIRPDLVEIAFTDKTNVPSVNRVVAVGGQYACAAFAGLAAALSPDAPLTNVPVPGITRLIHSNDYFRPDQLNVIAEGGNNILVQETRNSIPYSRQQLTTDMTSLVTREFSIIKIVDYSAKFVRNSLRPYIGNRNITLQYLTQLRGTVEAIIRSLVRAGILMANTQLLTLKQDQDSPDQIIIEIALDIPYPANRILVTLYV